jgi:hypothetical protein
MLALPYTTFDEIAAHGLEVEIECRKCRHRAMADPASPLLRGKRFVDVRFRCQQFVQPWSAQPARRCHSLGHIHIKPTPDKKIHGQGIMRAYVTCGNCMPSWSIDQAPLDDPLWKPIWGRATRSNRLVCPGCGRKLITAWTGDGVDSWKRAEPGSSGA